MKIGPITHADLVELAYKWVLKRGSCGVAFKELRTLACNGEFPDVIGFGSGCSTVVECKVSRADFLADAKKTFRLYPELGMGQERYYCCPKGLLRVEDLPANWGLLEVSEGRKILRIHYPYKGGLNRFSPNLRAEHELMYSALRRLFLKGYGKYVYDKDYSGSGMSADELIAINELLKNDE